MKFVLAVFALSAVVAFTSALPADAKDKKLDRYTEKYDNINIDEILSNERLITSYYKCLMDEAKCTSDGAELKKSLPDALSNKCARCSDKQKIGSEKIIHFLIEKKPKLWEKLEEKYDPKQTYKTLYSEEAAKRGIKIQ